MAGAKYREVHRRSLADPEGFWAEQARAIDWTRPWDTVLDASNPPFYRWFAGAELNTSDGRGNVRVQRYDRSLEPGVDGALRESGFGERPAVSVRVADHVVRREPLDDGPEAGVIVASPPVTTTRRKPESRKNAARRSSSSVG